MVVLHRPQLDYTVSLAKVEIYILLTNVVNPPFDTYRQYL